MPQNLHRLSLPHLSQASIRESARRCGFHLCGIAPVLDENTEDMYPELAAFPEWIAQGRAGEMEYLKRRDEHGSLLRSSIRLPFPWARSVIVCAVNYNSDEGHSIDTQNPSDGWIARYAWSGVPDGSGELAPTDYHHVIRDRLERLREELRSSLGEFEARCFVDTGPLIERIYAKYAGIGWQGKNTCLIHEKMGSWLFLGVILTSLDLEPNEWARPMPDRCGSCTRCIDACPTQALEPYRMDASRCISYLTIEKRGAIPEDLAVKVGRNVFGCDICQEVCPWNGRAPITDWPELQPRHEMVNPALDWLAGLDEADFRRLFRRSPIERAKYAGFKRNVEIARHNGESHSAKV